MYNNVNTNKTFRTKSGYCEVLPDKIVIVRSGWRGKLSQFVLGDSIVRILVLYGLLILLFAYLAYDAYVNEHKFFMFYCGFVAVYLAYFTVKSVNNSVSPIIYRDTIKNIKLIRGVESVTRNRFEIRFDTGNGKVRKRVIILPGVLQHGKEETFKALGIFVDEGLMSA